MICPRMSDCSTGGPTHYGGPAAAWDLSTSRRRTAIEGGTYSTRCFLLCISQGSLHCGSWWDVGLGLWISRSRPTALIRRQIGRTHAFSADLVHASFLATDTTEAKACLVKAGRCFGVTILLPNMGRAWKRTHLGPALSR
jgi:hypothetical protein